MDETKLRKIAQLEEFLEATPSVRFSSGAVAGSGVDERYAHISCVLKRFDYPHRKKGECGVMLAYLQRTSGYSRAQITLTKTRPVCNPIGVRKAPRPNGRAGWVRIDSVHQGDLDGIKGVYHITLRRLRRTHRASRRLGEFGL